MCKLVQNVYYLFWQQFLYLVFEVKENAGNCSRIFLRMFTLYCMYTTCLSIKKKRNSTVIHVKSIFQNQCCTFNQMLMHFSYPHRGLIILHFITCKIMVYKHRVIPLTIRHHLGTEFAHHGLVQEYPLCRTTAPTEHKTHCHHVTQDKLKEEI